MAFPPDLGQVFYFGGIAPAKAKFWVSSGAIWQDMLLVEAPVSFQCVEICLKLFQNSLISPVTTALRSVVLILCCMFSVFTVPS